MTTMKSRALRIAAWSNIAIAAAHAIGLIWAWSFFRAVGIDHEMRELATQGAALPYVLTVTTAAVFLVFGLYALSGAGDLRRLPLLRTALAAIAAIYLFRATLYGGIAALLDGDGPQIAFAAIALIIGLCYAGGAIAYRRLDDGAPNLRVGADPRTSHAAG
ncbi:MAG: hypothetical protein M3376_11405 [Actinomycetota bacterium]|nr:hypothetical protein [Actinomycetota bacterium]